jgi:hypothetical protein
MRGAEVLKDAGGSEERSAIDEALGSLGSRQANFHDIIQNLSGVNVFLTTY